MRFRQSLMKYSEKYRVREPQGNTTRTEQKLCQYTAIDEFSGLRFVYGYEEHSTYSSADFLFDFVGFIYNNGGIQLKTKQVPLVTGNLFAA